VRIEFLSPLRLEVVGKHHWKLLEDFSAVVINGHAETITVPAGFVCDLASVPRFPGMYMLFGGRARRSAVLHDWLYSRRRDRDFADAVFYEAMRHEEGVMTRVVMWLGVRLGGWPQYLKNPGPTPGAIEP
jgi:hypothetical protein